MKATLLIRIIERNPTLTVERLASMIYGNRYHSYLYAYERKHFTFLHDTTLFTYYLHRRGYTGRDIAKMLCVSEKVVSQRLMKVRTNKEKYDLKLVENML